MDPPLQTPRSLRRQEGRNSSAIFRPRNRAGPGGVPAPGPKRAAPAPPPGALEGILLKLGSRHFPLGPKKKPSLGPNNPHQLSPRAAKWAGRTPGKSHDRPNCARLCDFPENPGSADEPPNHGGGPPFRPSHHPPGRQNSLALLFLFARDTLWKRQNPGTAINGPLITPTDLGRPPWGRRLRPHRVFIVKMFSCPPDRPEEGRLRFPPDLPVFGPRHPQTIPL